MTDKPRFSVTMEPELVERIALYRYNHRISTQSKAIQQLVKMGFDSVEGNKKPDPLTEAGLNYQERELIRLARQAAPVQREIALRVLELAVENEQSAMRKN